MVSIWFHLFILFRIFPPFILVCFLVPCSIHLIIFFGLFRVSFECISTDFVVFFSQSFGSFTGESLYVCEFLFLPCRGLAASSGLGSLPQCAAIVWLCGSPLPIAKLFRRAPSPFSFFLVPARLRALASLISIVFISHRIFSSCSRLFPGTRHFFCIVHVFTRFCVSIFSLSHCFHALLVPPILAFLPLELFDLIALACFFPPTKQTHELIADCANTLLFLSRAV